MEEWESLAGVTCSYFEQRIEFSLSVAIFSASTFPYDILLDKLAVLEVISGR